jgi:hypothetical protein
MQIQGLVFAGTATPHRPAMAPAREEAASFVEWRVVADFRLGICNSAPLNDGDGGQGQSRAGSPWRALVVPRRQYGFGNSASRGQPWSLTSADRIVAAIVISPPT